MQTCPPPSKPAIYAVTVARRREALERLRAKAAEAEKRLRARDNNAT